MTSHDTAPMVHPAASAPSFWVMGDQVTVRAKLHGTALNVIDVRVPPGSGVPPHTHASAEIFRVLEGTLTIWRMIDGVAGEHEARPGDVVTIPGNAPHGYRNIGSGSCVFTAIVDDEMVAFFEEAASRQAPSGPPTADVVRHIMELSGRHGIQILQAA